MSTHLQDSALVLQNSATAYAILRAGDQAKLGGKDRALLDLPKGEAWSPAKSHRARIDR